MRNFKKYLTFLMLLVSGLGHAQMTQEFYDSTRVKAEGLLANGKKEGLWKYYDPSGVVEAEMNFKNVSWRKGDLKITQINGQIPIAEKVLWDGQHLHFT